MTGDAAPFPAIPYGRGNFRAIRLDGCLYVDKTRFIRTLEQEGRYAAEAAAGAGAAVPPRAAE